MKRQHTAQPNRQAQSNEQRVLRTQSETASAQTHPLLALQRQIGNAQVARMLAQREGAEEEIQAKHDAVQREGAEEDEVQARHDIQRDVDGTRLEVGLAAGPINTPQTQHEVRGTAVLGLQRAVGNVRVAQELAQRSRTSETVQAYGTQTNRQDLSSTSAQRIITSTYTSASGSHYSVFQREFGENPEEETKKPKWLKWLGKQMWSKLKGTFHRTVNWFKQLPPRLERLFNHIWNGVKSLKPWSLSWWESLGNISTWTSLLEWLGASLIYILEISGIGEVYETAADFIKFNTRELTSDEIDTARFIFGNSIDYKLVRVDTGAVIGPPFKRRQYTSFHTINSWGAIDPPILIHELTHVWQYQKMGAIYMPMAIYAQITTKYNYGGFDELIKRKEAGKGLESFDLEQQGQIAEDYMTNLHQLSPEDRATYEYFLKVLRT